MSTQVEELKLENQICFPIYAVSRMVTKMYTPLLERLDITYPQYLVLLVLWEGDHRSVSDISELLYLESNTLTPLLKRMETKGLITRQRSADDERRVLVTLTQEGKGLQEEARCIPMEVVSKFQSEDITLEEVVQFKATMGKMMQLFSHEK